MTNYKTIHGKRVKFLSSDPPGSVGEGQVWYNSSDTEFKSSIKVAAWGSGGAIPTATSSIKGSGTLTAGLAFGGNVPSNTDEKILLIAKNIMVLLGLKLLM